MNQKHAYTCIYIYIMVFDNNVYIYIYRLKAGGSPELRGTLSLDAIPERSFLSTDGGVGGGVITSCEVRWMMLNPGRCCLVGRCCYVASFVVVTEGVHKKLLQHLGLHQLKVLLTGSIFSHP